MNPYKVLGIRPNASLDEIKTAYESLANTYDISNYQGSSEEPLAEDKISELNTAYNSLINEYKYKDIRDLKRIPKKSYHWVKKAFESNGEDLD